MWLLALIKTLTLEVKETLSGDVTNEDLMKILENALFDQICFRTCEESYLSVRRNRSSEAFARDSMSGSSQCSYNSRSANVVPFSSFKCSMAAEGYFNIQRVVLDYDKVGIFIEEQLNITSDQLEAFLLSEAYVLQMLRGCLVSTQEVSHMHPPVFKIFLELFMKRLGRICEGFVPYAAYKYRWKISGTIRAGPSDDNNPMGRKKMEQRLDDDEEEEDTLTLKGSVGDFVLMHEDSIDRSDLRHVRLIVVFKRLLGQVLTDDGLSAKSELLAQVHCVSQSIIAADEYYVEEDFQPSCVKGLLTDLFAINLMWRFPSSSSSFSEQPNECSKPGGDIFITSTAVSVREYLLGLLLTYCNVRNGDDLCGLAATVQAVVDIDDDDDAAQDLADEQTQSHTQSQLHTESAGGGLNDVVLSFDDNYDPSSTSRYSSSKERSYCRHLSVPVPVPVGQGSDSGLRDERKFGYLSAYALLSKSESMTALEKF